jgi:hypothetical protein
MNVLIPMEFKKVSIIKNMSQIIREWEFKNRNYVFDNSGLPDWLVDDFDDFELSENFRSEYFFIADGICCTFTLCYKVWISNKSFNRLKIQNNFMTKLINHKYANFSTSDGSYFYGIDCSHKT